MWCPQCRIGSPSDVFQSSALVNHSSRICMRAASSAPSQPAQLSVEAEVASNSFLTNGSKQPIFRQRPVLASPPTRKAKDAAETAPGPRSSSRNQEHYQAPRHPRRAVFDLELPLISSDRNPSPHGRRSLRSQSNQTIQRSRPHHPPRPNATTSVRPREPHGSLEASETASANGISAKGPDARAASTASGVPPSPQVRHLTQPGPSDSLALTELPVTAIPLQPLVEPSRGDLALMHSSAVKSSIAENAIPARRPAPTPGTPAGGADGMERGGRREPGDLGSSGRQPASSLFGPTARDGRAAASASSSETAAESVVSGRVRNASGSEGTTHYLSDASVLIRAIASVELPGPQASAPAAVVNSSSYDGLLLYNKPSSRYGSDEIDAATAAVALLAALDRMPEATTALAGPAASPLRPSSLLPYSGADTSTSTPSSVSDGTTDPEPTSTSMRPASASTADTLPGLQFTLAPSSLLHAVTGSVEPSDDLLPYSSWDAASPVGPSFTQHNDSHGRSSLPPETNLLGPGRTPWSAPGLIARGAAAVPLIFAAAGIAPPPWASAVLPSPPSAPSASHAAVDPYGPTAACGGTQRLDPALDWALEVLSHRRTPTEPGPRALRLANRTLAAHLGGPSGRLRRLRAPRGQAGRLSEEGHPSSGTDYGNPSSSSCGGGEDGGTGGNGGDGRGAVPWPLMLPLLEVMGERLSPAAVLSLLRSVSRQVSPEWHSSLPPRQAAHLGATLRAAFGAAMRSRATITPPVAVGLLAVMARLRVRSTPAAAQLLSIVVAAVAPQPLYYHQTTAAPSGTAATGAPSPAGRKGTTQEGAPAPQQQLSPPTLSPEQPSKRERPQDEHGGTAPPLSTEGGSSGGGSGVCGSGGVSGRVMTHPDRPATGTRTAIDSSRVTTATTTMEAIMTTYSFSGRASRNISDGSSSSSSGCGIQGGTAGVHDLSLQRGSSNSGGVAGGRGEGAGVLERRSASAKSVAASSGPSPTSPATSFSGHSPLLLLPRQRLLLASNALCAVGRLRLPVGLLPHRAVTKLLRVALDAPSYWTPALATALLEAACRTACRPPAAFLRRYTATLLGHRSRRHRTPSLPRQGRRKVPPAAPSRLRLASRLRRPRQVVRRQQRSEQGVGGVQTPARMPRVEIPEDEELEVARHSKAGDGSDLSGAPNLASAAAVAAASPSPACLLSRMTVRQLVAVLESLVELYGDGAAEALAGGWGLPLSRQGPTQRSSISGAGDGVGDEAGSDPRVMVRAGAAPHQGLPPRLMVALVLALSQRPPHSLGRGQLCRLPLLMYRLGWGRHPLLPLKGRQTWLQAFSDRTRALLPRCNAVDVMLLLRGLAAATAAAVKTKSAASDNPTVPAPTPMVERSGANGVCGAHFRQAGQPVAAAAGAAAADVASFEWLADELGMEALRRYLAILPSASLLQTTTVLDSLAHLWAAPHHNHRNPHPQPSLLSGQQRPVGGSTLFSHAQPSPRSNMPGHPIAGQTVKQHPQRQPPAAQSPAEHTAQQPTTPKHGPQLVADLATQLRRRLAADMASERAFLLSQLNRHLTLRLRQAAAAVPHSSTGIRGGGDIGTGSGIRDRGEGGRANGAEGAGVGRQGKPETPQWQHSHHQQQQMAEGVLAGRLAVRLLGAWVTLEQRPPPPLQTALEGLLVAQGGALGTDGWTRVRRSYKLLGLVPGRDLSVAFVTFG